MSNKRGRNDAFDYINIFFLLLLAMIVLLPFYFTVIKSFMSQKDWLFSKGTIPFPTKFTLENYTGVFKSGKISVGYMNSVIYTVLGVAYSMFLTSTMAYGLSKRSFPGRKIIQNLVVFTMYFGGGLVPYFLVVKGLGLYNMRAAVIVATGGLNVFNMIIMRTFFEQLPRDLEEAAIVDGAGQLRVFVQIILPLVKPMLATVTLFYAVDRWNEWFASSLFLADGSKWPIQLVLRQILWSTTAFRKLVPQEAGRPFFTEGIKASAVIITMLPIMCVYPFLQKYFVKGIMVGAIKS